MTTIDQWELADLAKELGGLYRQLDARKHEKTQAPRGERVMKPTPGPREPAAGWAISLDAQLTAELHEMTRDAINYTDRRAILLAHSGERLCSTIRSNAMEIAEQFPAANDLADLMRDQAAQLERKLTPVAHVQVEQRQTARSITPGGGIPPRVLKGCRHILSRPAAQPVALSSVATVVRCLAVGPGVLSSPRQWDDVV